MDAALVAKLYDNTFLLGRFRRKAAIKTLLAADEPEAIEQLVAALNKNHPEADSILAGLRRLKPKIQSEKVSWLWLAFAHQPQRDLAEILIHLGWPASQPITPKVVRSVLAVAKAGIEISVLAAVAAFAELIPVDDGAGNDEIYLAWIRSKAEVLDKLIVRQQRRPANPVYEALHALVAGDLAQYQNLQDQDGRLLSHAYALASPVFRSQITLTVANSTDRRLKQAYRLALSSETLSHAERIDSLIRVNDDDGLFELCRKLSLAEVLELCQYWAQTANRPSLPEQAAVVEQAVAAYRRLQYLQRGPEQKLPKGLVDIFDYWYSQQPSDGELRSDLRAEDPFEQARGLFLGYQRQLVGQAALTAAADSKHWPLRMVAQLLDPQGLGKTAKDHVQWVRSCADDAVILQIPIAATPFDYACHTRQLQLTHQPSAARRHCLLEILCLFQGAFVGSSTEVLELDEAADATAISTEDVPDNVDFN